MPRTTAAHDVVLSGTLADGTTLLLGLMLAPSENGADPRVIQSSLSAQSGDAPLSQDLATLVQEDWSRGVGLDYDGAYGVDTRTPGYAFPAGAGTNVSVVGFANATLGPIVAFAEFNGDLYVAQRGIEQSAGGRVLKLTGGTGAAAASLTAPATSGVAGDTDLIQDLIVADSGVGVTTMYATSASATNENGRMYSLTVAGAGVWGGGTRGVEFAATRGLFKMAKVSWIDETSALTNPRIVVLTGTANGRKFFAYTLVNANPMSGTASFSADIRVETVGSLLDIAAFRRHVFLAGTDNVYDVNEVGESNGTTSYLPKMIHTDNAACVATQSGYVYYGNKRGLFRIFVGDETLDESPLEGNCSPGWGTPSEGAFRGAVTAVLEEGGGIWAAVHEPTQKRSYIFWGVDRRTVGVESPNPLIWHGPLVVLDADYKVTKMHASTLAGDSRLWIGSQSVGTPTNTRLDWVHITAAGTPIQDIASVGTHRFCTQATSPGVLQGYSVLEGLADSWGDKGIKKILYQWSVGARGPLTTTTPRLRLDTRADPAPGAATPPAGSGTYPTGNMIPPDATTWTPSMDVTPDTVSGNKTQYRVAFFTPSGGQTPPILDSVRALAWKRAPSLDTLALTVQYGEGVANDDAVHPDTKSAWLKLATESGRLTLRLPNDERLTVALRQVKQTQVEYFDGGTWGKRVQATIECSVLGNA